MDKIAEKHYMAIRNDFLKLPTGQGEKLITKDLHIVNQNLVFLESEILRQPASPERPFPAMFVRQVTTVAPGYFPLKKNPKQNTGIWPPFCLNNTFFFKTYYCLCKCLQWRLKNTDLWPGQCGSVAEHRSMKQEFTGSNPGKITCPGCGPVSSR